jgi:hypothetical protein
VRVKRCERKERCDAREREEHDVMRDEPMLAERKVKKG